MTEKEHFITIREDDIRRQWDEKNDLWHFSVVDIIAIAKKSSDARNYWKVLKNRLKKADSELVTKCNQLKMLANDGKWYLTDTADAETMLQILEIAAPSSVKAFSRWFEQMAPHDPYRKVPEHETGDEMELTVDLYETPTDLVIHSLVAGVSLDELFISVDYKTLTIRGNRIMPPSNHVKAFTFEEIYWGPFSRTITLPTFVEVAGVTATERYGMLVITLPKINTAQTRTVKVRPL